VEGYTELISWSRINKRDIWDLRKQIDVVRIASYFGHREIVDVSLQQNPNSSSNNVLIYSAVLGCAEAGRAMDMALFFDQNLKFVIQIHVPSDPFINVHSNGYHYVLVDLFMPKNGKEGKNSRRSKLRCSRILLRLWLDASSMPLYKLGIKTLCKSVKYKYARCLSQSDQATSFEVSH
jgi:hypothetical protein